MSSAQETTRVCLACGLETQDEISTCPNDGSLMTAGRDPLVGTTFLDKYQITDVLGRGGMSAVYKAKHMMMDRYVAIKFLRSELVHDNVMLQRFQLESKAVSLLKHPNIIAVHDFGLSPTGVPYLIMDFLEGKTVADLVAECEYLEPDRCVSLFTQICSALAHTHNRGVIHRDIKPSNLIVSIGDEGQEVAQVVDFGIAKMLEREASDAAKLTASGEVFGSPAYMSPEQCNGSSIDARTDIYALACVIYNCLTGRPPLLGKNAMETVLMHIRDMPKPFGDIRPDLSISPKLEQVVFKALAKDPDERYASMAEFSAELAKSILPRNNNTTWNIPTPKESTASTSVVDPTIKIGQSPNIVPMAKHQKSAQTMSMKPDAIEPSLDLGHADPVVSLNTDQAHPNNESPNMVSDAARGRMNPNAMIVPGSDLFGYESLRPAAPDPGSSQGEPKPARVKPTLVDEIPLAAPVPHAPSLQKPTPNPNPAAVTKQAYVAPASANDKPALPAPISRGSGGSPSPGPGQLPGPEGKHSNPAKSATAPKSTGKSEAANASDKAKETRMLVIAGIISIVIVIAMLIFLWKSQAQ